MATTLWLAKLDDKGPWAAVALGLIVSIAFLLSRCALDGIFLATSGFPAGYEPLWQSSLWWPEIVNAVLVGYLPAALVIARQGIYRDFRSLSPWLPQNDAGAASMHAAATRPARLAGRIFKLCVLAGSIALVFIDPSLTLGTEPSLANPAFLWSLLRIPVFIWLVCTLAVADIIATQTYYRAGRNLIEVDLLDVHSLTSFARRGLRSSLIWVIFSIIFSLFWLGDDTAYGQNFSLLVIVLAMATTTFVIPMMGVRANILSVKRKELDRLREEIRGERAAVSKLQTNNAATSPRLANLIAYYQLIDRTQEWPIDAVNVLKFFLYLLIGLGSWLGGALVEVMLDRTLSG
ncbi:MAG: hypothetical protein V7709_05800 [Halioglobus sp.]